MNYDVNCSFDNLRVFCHLAADGDSDDDEDEETGKSKITLAYQSKRTSEREGLQDMGATLTLETESKTKVVINVLKLIQPGLMSYLLLMFRSAVRTKESEFFYVNVHV